MVEVLQCETCFDTFMRTVVRGRKPRRCPSCVRWNVPVQPVRRPRVPSGVQVVKTDGGQSESGIWERNDCTVRALAIGCGVSYQMAHEFMRKNGRKPGKGAYFHQIIARYTSQGKPVLGKMLVGQNLNQSKGLRTTLLRNPQLRTGTWILHCTSHVCVLRDGVLFDSFDSSRKQYDMAWRVLEA